jgi:hypothetical protein
MNRCLGTGTGVFLVHERKYPYGTGTGNYHRGQNQFLRFKKSRFVICKSDQACQKMTNLRDPELRLFFPGLFSYKFIYLITNVDCLGSSKV